MSMLYTVYDESPDGKEIKIEVDFEWYPPVPAGLFDPDEGGVEILGVESDHPLTDRQRERAERACIEYCWECHYSGEHPQ